MLHGALQTGKILMLEPRRIAAEQVAIRMAHMLGETVGKLLVIASDLKAKYHLKLVLKSSQKAFSHVCWLMTPHSMA